MDGIIVRKATLDDLDTLLQFEQGVIKAERAFDITLKMGHINYYNLEKMLQAKDVEVAVAEFNDSLIGSGYARIETSKSFFQYEKYAYLGFMYVVPEHRGKE